MPHLNPSCQNTETWVDWVDHCQVFSGGGGHCAGLWPGTYAALLDAGQVFGAGRLSHEDEPTLEGWKSPTDGSLKVGATGLQMGMVLASGDGSEPI